MWSLFIVPFTNGDKIKTTGKCYHSVGGLTFCQAQSDHIKRLLLYNKIYRLYISTIAADWLDCKPYNCGKNSSSDEVVNSIYDFAAVPNRAEKKKAKKFFKMDDLTLDPGIEMLHHV